MTDDAPSCSLSNRARFRRNSWVAIGLGLLAFWGGVAWLVFG